MYNEKNNNEIITKIKTTDALMCVLLTRWLAFLLLLDTQFVYFWGGFYYYYYYIIVVNTRHTRTSKDIYMGRGGYKN